MRILTVEDEPRLAQLIERALRGDGYHVDVCLDGMDGFERARGGSYDAMTLDILLPRMSGLEIAMRLRRLHIRTPILMLTAKDSVEDRVSGLDVGADDYLIKPFAREELLARMRAILRRNADPIHAGELRVKDLVLDRVRREVRRGDRRTELTAREFDLLDFLMRNAGRVLSREQIIRAVWSQDYAGEANVVDTYIHYLREKVDRGAGERLIRTVRGVGYVLGH